MTPGKLRTRRGKRGISILVEAVVVAIMVISAFAVSYFYITPSNPRLQRSQTDVSQLGYNLLNSLASNGEFDYTIINGPAISNFYTDCVYFNPSISATPPSAWASSPPSEETFNITAVNNDRFCGSELFTVTVVLPSTSWADSLTLSTLSITSNGGSATTSLSVTPPSTVGSGAYNITIIITNDAITVPMSLAEATTQVQYIIGNALPCVQNPPTVNIAPSTETQPSGGSASYSISITNNDRNCGLETFSVAALPHDLNLITSYLNTSSATSTNVTVNSQDAGATTVYLESPASFQGTNTTRVVVTNLENIQEATTESFTYSFKSSSGTCSRSTPTVSSTLASESGSAGTVLTFAVVITSYDQNCGLEPFSVSISAPSGWAVSYSTSIDVASSAKAGFEVTVTSPNNASPGNYNMAVTVTSPGLETASTTLTYIIQSSSSCTYVNPSLSLSPPSEWGTGGSKLAYRVSVVNNDAPGCGAESFTSAFTPPSRTSGWSGFTSPSSIVVSGGGGRGQFTLFVTSPPTSKSSNITTVYPFSISVDDLNHSSTRTIISGQYTVENPCTSISFACLYGNGWIVPGWQRNIEFALLSVVPEGYVFNLTVSLVYALPGEPYSVQNIPLNNGTLITNGSPQSFKNAGQVVDVLYVYTTPKLYVLFFQLQLAQVTSP